MDWIRLGRLVTGSCIECGIIISKVQLDLLSDSDMLLMIESGIGEEIATILHHHAKANNEYMGTELNPTKDAKFIRI